MKVSKLVSGNKTSQSVLSDKGFSQVSLFTRSQTASIIHQPHISSKVKKKKSPVCLFSKFFCQQLLQKAISKNSSQSGNPYISILL